MSIIKRGSTYQLRRRVPKRFKNVESRSVIWISLHTDSQSIAQRKAIDAWEQMVQAWEAKLAGSSNQADERYEAARELADIRGFRYMDVNAAPQLATEKFLDRITSISSAAPIEATALLSIAKKPSINLSSALEMFWDMTSERTLCIN